MVVQDPAFAPVPQDNPDIEYASASNASVEPFLKDEEKVEKPLHIGNLREVEDRSQSKRVCWCVCSSCLACILIVVLVLVQVLLPGFFHVWFRERVCMAKTCMNFMDAKRAEKCMACRTAFDVDVSQLVVGANGVPFGYYWLALGSLAEDINLNVVKEYTEIQRLSSILPSMVYNGQWWRGNELGGIINNPYFWSSLDIWPQSNVLGATSRQHSNMRPFLLEAFKADRHNESTDLASENQWIRKSLRLFLEQRRLEREIKVPEDLITWTHQILYENALLEPVDWLTAKEFAAVQQKQLRLDTVSQVLPASLYKLLGSRLGMTEARRSAERYVGRYTKSVNRLWKADLNRTNCTPSANCSYQLASALWDTFVTVGGSSMPGGLHSGLAMIYSTSSTNPVPKDFKIKRGEERNFFWETIRFIPPVYGFPFWQPRPTCAGRTIDDTLMLNRPDGETEACPKLEAREETGFSPVNQWISPKGGHRSLISLVSGQKEASVWGDPESFRVRSIQDYQQYSVGFAEPAVDFNIENGKSNRDCPGKELALVIGQIFWEEFNKEVDHWAPEHSDIAIDPLGPFSQVPAFVLRLKESEASEKGSGNATTAAAPPGPR